MERTITIVYHVPNARPLLFFSRIYMAAASRFHFNNPGFELKTTPSSVKCGNSIYVDYYYFLYVCTSCDLHYSSNCECVSSPVCKSFRISYENLFIAFRELSISLLICMRLKLEMQQI